MADVTVPFVVLLTRDEAFRSVMRTGTQSAIYDTLSAIPAIWAFLPDENTKQQLAAEIANFSHWDELDSVWQALLNEAAADFPGSVFC